MKNVDSCGFRENQTSEALGERKTRDRMQALAEHTLNRAIRYSNRIESHPHHKAVLLEEV
jgi:hypothetical protein